MRAFGKAYPSKNSQALKDKLSDAINENWMST